MIELVVTIHQKYQIHNSLSKVVRTKAHLHQRSLASFTRGKNELHLLPGHKVCTPGLTTSSSGRTRKLAVKTVCFAEWTANFHHRVAIFKVHAHSTIILLLLLESLDALAKLGTLLLHESCDAGVVLGVRESCTVLKVLEKQLARKNPQEISSFENGRNELVGGQRVSGQVVDEAGVHDAVPRERKTPSFGSWHR